MKAGMRLRNVSGKFFDSKVVMSATDRAERRILSRAGAYVRRISRSSIRRRKNPSKPGKAPTNWVGTLKKLIFFTYDTNRKTVVIGPTKSGRGIVPNVLEEGGHTTVEERSFEYERNHEGMRAKVFKGIKKHKVMIKKRPYMKPAFDKVLPTVAEQFQNSIR